MGKQFKAAVAAAKPVYGQIMGSAPQKYEEPEKTGLQEAQEVPEVREIPGMPNPFAGHGPQEKARTQGRKGAKQPRINMAFSSANLDYLRIMAGLNGQSITHYVNRMVERERERNTPAFEAAKKLIQEEKA